MKRRSHTQVALRAVGLRTAMSPESQPVAGRSKRLDHHQDHDADHQDCRYLIDNTIEFFRVPVPVGGEIADPPHQKAVQRGQHQHQGELGVKPAATETTAVQASQSPSTQVTTIAGLMITVSSRRSITLKVSDCGEPGSASQ